METKLTWPSQRSTTPEGVYGVLRAAILDGTLPPGGQLREVQIAEDLGISRSPLREALPRLEEEGLVVKVPFRGRFVAKVDPREISDMAALRLLLEPYAAQLSFEALRGQQRPMLLQIMEQLHRAADENDIPASIDAHLRFHGLFYDFSGNDVLRSLWNSWETRLRLYLAADHRAYEDLHDVAVEHQRLADIALEGDIDRFRDELANHFPLALRHGT
ncbi:GntR family transcriptional regulator [Arthrobacter sp. NPDC093139]|uniref:GntR family transcriptional regulator n=1 Tax=Arthrobacter sp. NPDC093139 TaxID=3363945 RepID=UPI003818D387